MESSSGKSGAPMRRDVRWGFEREPFGLVGGAEDFSIHCSTVLDHPNRSNCSSTLSSARRHGEVNIAKRLYGSGLSVCDAGTALEVHASTVRSEL
jgi:hypothetical protein